MRQLSAVSLHSAAVEAAEQKSSKAARRIDNWAGMVKVGRQDCSSVQYLFLPAPFLPYSTSRGRTRRKATACSRPSSASGITLPSSSRPSTLNDAVSPQATVMA
jgi:hypothetical protein